MSDKPKMPAPSDTPLGILPDGQLNTVERDAPPWEPTIEEGELEDGFTPEEIAAITEGGGDDAELEDGGD